MPSKEYSFINMNAKRVILLCGIAVLIVASLLLSFPKPYIGHSKESRCRRELFKFKREFEINPDIAEMLGRKLGLMLGQKLETTIESKEFFRWVKTSMPGQERYLFNEYSRNVSDFVDIWSNPIHLLVKQSDHANRNLIFFVWSSGQNEINNNHFKDDIVIQLMLENTDPEHQ